VIGRLPFQDSKIDLPLPGRQGNPVHAVTHYHVSRQFPDATLVRVKIDTGRLHQIRLHFAKLGYPVIMDEQHGDFAFNRRFRKQFGLKRQFLHAEKLALEHAGKLKQWMAPLPQDLTEVLKKLSTHQP
jgi:23S rRNA pseudouridine955/2504/2580 synthase